MKLRYLKKLGEHSDYELMEYMELLNRRKKEMLEEQEMLLLESQDWSAAMATLIFEMKVRDMTLSAYWLYQSVDWDAKTTH